ncbi:hypothetical protein HDU92_000527 [Lobulomyces angularis]|nr:hypothetical protein HDU92_000527 [Lobulomyces angularis]
MQERIKLALTERLAENATNKIFLKIGPLFLEETPMNVFYENLFGTIISISIFLTILESIYFAFMKDLQHLFLGLCLGGYLLLTLQMIRWYREGHLEPRYKFAILFLSLNLIFLCLLVNVYIWEKKVFETIDCPGTLLPDNNGLISLLRKSDGTCWGECFVGFCLDSRNGLPGVCRPC